MLLRMRHIPPKATFRPDNGILKAVDGSDEHVVRWFDMIQITRKATPDLIHATFLTDFISQHTTSKSARTPSSTHPTHAPWIATTVPTSSSPTTPPDPSKQQKINCFESHYLQRGPHAGEYHHYDMIAAAKHACNEFVRVLPPFPSGRGHLV
jgi:hypothetical protein